MELTNTEQLAIAQALYNHLGKMVSTKDPDNLRGEADAHYKALFEETGAKSFDVRINGEKVGTYTVKVSKPTPAITRKDFTITDKDKLLCWAATQDTELVYDYVSERLEDFALWYSTLTGEAPKGCEWVATIEPGKEPEYMGGVLKVDADAVANVTRSLNIGVAGLLEE